MEVYGPKNVIDSLMRVFSFKIIPDAIYISIGIGVESSVREDLIFARRLVRENPDEIIILYGIDAIQKLWLNPMFRKTMVNTRVRYANVFNLLDMMKKYSEKKFENPALDAIADIDCEKDIIGNLRHDYHYNKEKVIKRAREELGWIGSDEKIEEKILHYEPRTVIEPQFFPGVFCDVEGTLVLKGKLNNLVKEKLVEYSEKKPVNIWTGSDLKEVVPFLKEYNIEYPLLSKGLFRGCTVETAIDDLDIREFKRMFGIKVKEFIQV